MTSDNIEITPSTTAVSNMNVWIVALYELEESKQVTRRLPRSASKNRMLSLAMTTFSLMFDSTLPSTNY